MRPPLADHPVFGRSLDALEGERPSGGPFASGDTAWAHRIRRVPLWALDDDDLAFLLARRRGVPPVLALALHRLREDPLRRTTLPVGLLVTVVAALDDTVWRDAGRDAWATMAEVVRQARGEATSADDLEELGLAAERFAAMLDSGSGSPP
jgi:hypothetical protein